MSKPASTAGHEGQSGGKSKSGMIKVAGLIVGIMLLEGVTAYFLMPSGAPAAHAAADSSEPADGDHAEADRVEPALDEHAAEDTHAKPAETKGHGGGHGDPHGDKAGPPKPVLSANEQEEVDLGEYSISGYHPVSNTTLFVTFHLYGTVLHKHADSFSMRQSASQHRIRENVIMIVRSADLNDLADAGLGLIKRRILETTNKTLGKPMLQSVVFSEFSFIEQ